MCIDCAPDRSGRRPVAHRTGTGIGSHARAEPIACRTRDCEPNPVARHVHVDTWGTGPCVKSRMCYTRGAGPSACPPTIALSPGSGVAPATRAIALDRGPSVSARARLCAQGARALSDRRRRARGQSHPDDTPHSTSRRRSHSWPDGEPIAEIVHLVDGEHEPHGRRPVEQPARKLRVIGGDDLAHAVDKQRVDREPDRNGNP